MKQKVYKNILIDAIMHLGDLIHATSLIPLLQATYPGCKISFMVEPGLVKLFDFIDGVEQVIPYGYKSKGDYLSVYRMGKMLKKYNFDLSISLDPRLRLSLMMWFADIPTRVGSRSIFWNKSGIERFFFTDYVDFGNYVCKQHPAAENFQKLVKLFSNNKNNEFYKPRFAVPTSKDIQYIDEQLHSLVDNKAKIAMCVKTVEATRNWPADKFIALINQIVDKYDAQIVLVGVNSDKDIIETILNGVEKKNNVIDIAGKTNLRQLNALFYKMDFLINFDNGMGHFAAAAGCPTLTLFSNALPLQFRPLHDKTLIVESGLACVQNCTKELRKNCGLKCLEAVTVAKVMDKVDEMMINLGDKK